MRLSKILKLEELVSLNHDLSHPDNHNDSKNKIYSAWTTWRFVATFVRLSLSKVLREQHFSFASLLRLNAEVVNL